VFAVKWIQAGVTHFGLTASYYGFVADGNFSFFCTYNSDVNALDILTRFQFCQSRLEII
jgi:hypothetical protein